MAQKRNLANIGTWADDDSGVWRAPLGTTLSDGLDEPEAPFVDLGWLSEDGIEVERKISSKDFKAFQGGKVVKTVTTDAADTLTFQCLEETATSLGMYYSGSEIKTDAEGITTFKVGPAATDEATYEVRLVEGPYVKAYKIRKGVISDQGKIVYKSTDLSVLEFTLTLIDFDIVTDSPAFAIPVTP